MIITKKLDFHPKNKNKRTFRLKTKSPTPIFHTFFQFYYYKINVTKPLSPSLTIRSIVCRIRFLAVGGTASIL